MIALVASRAKKKTWVVHMGSQKLCQWVAQQCRGKDVLDVGCVGGGVSHDHPCWLHGKIKQHARSVLGIDINLREVRKLQRLGYNVEYANAEGFSIKRKFDVIVAGELIGNLSNPGLFLDCARRHLRKNGRLVLTVTNARHFYGFMDVDVGSSVQLYNFTVLKRLLKRHGFEIIQGPKYFSGEPKNLRGKLYENLFARIFPQFSLYFGVVAKSINLGNGKKNGN